jgi:hypothetical protein
MEDGKKRLPGTVLLLRRHRRATAPDTKAPSADPCWRKEPSRRAARYGDGWYGFHIAPEATKRSIDWIRGYIENGACPSELGDLEISVAPSIPISKQVIRQYDDIGVHRLIPWLNAPTLDDTLRYVDELGTLLSG